MSLSSRIIEVKVTWIKKARQIYLALCVDSLQDSSFFEVLQSSFKEIIHMPYLVCGISLYKYVKFLFPKTKKKKLRAICDILFKCSMNYVFVKKTVKFIACVSEF